MAYPQMFPGPPNIGKSVPYSDYTCHAESQLPGRADGQNNFSAKSFANPVAHKQARNSEFDIRKYTQLSPILDCNQNNPSYQEILDGRLPSLESWLEIIQEQIRGDKKTSDVEKILCSRSRFHDIHQELTAPGSIKKPFSWPGKPEAWKNHVKFNYKLKDELNVAYDFNGMLLQGPRVLHITKTAGKDEVHTPLEESFNIISAAHLECTITTKDGQADTKHNGRDATFKKIKLVSDSIPKKWVTAFVQSCPHPVCIKNRTKGEDTKATGQKGGPGSKRKAEEILEKEDFSPRSGPISLDKKPRNELIDESTEERVLHLLDYINGPDNLQQDPVNDDVDPIPSPPPIQQADFRVNGQENLQQDPAYADVAPMQFHPPIQDGFAINQHQIPPPIQDGYAVNQHQITSPIQDGFAINQHQIPPPHINAGFMFNQLQLQIPPRNIQTGSMFNYHQIPPHIQAGFAINQQHNPQRYPANDDAVPMPLLSMQADFAVNEQENSQPSYANDNSVPPVSLPAMGVSSQVSEPLLLPEESQSPSQANNSHDEGAADQTIFDEFCIGLGGNKEQAPVSNEAVVEHDLNSAHVVDDGNIDPAVLAAPVTASISAFMGLPLYPTPPPELTTTPVEVDMNVWAIPEGSFYSDMFAGLGMPGDDGGLAAIEDFFGTPVSN